MIPILAKESIILKSRRDHNSILGNYECAYAIGLMSKLSGISILQDRSDLTAVFDDFVAKLKDYKPADVQQERIKKILLLYKPDAVNDAQTIELLEMGLKEEKPWII